MTPLLKAIHRETTRVKATKNGRIELADASGFITAQARPVIVSLLPSDCVRLSGTIKCTLDYEDRVEKYKKQKAAGYNVRKPKMPKNVPLGNYLRKVLRAIL